MKPGDKFQEKEYEGSFRIMKIKLIEYLGHDLWRAHCRNEMGGNVKYYYADITGADIIEYYDKIEEA